MAPAGVVRPGGAPPGDAPPGRGGRAGDGASGIASVGSALRCSGAPQCGQAEHGTVTDPWQEGQRMGASRETAAIPAAVYITRGRIAGRWLDRHPGGTYTWAGDK
jgi:hypothetical protein